MARKTVREITVSGITLPIYGCSTGEGATADCDSTAAYGDEWFSEIPRKCKHSNDCSLVCLNEGGAAATLKALVGTVQTLTISIAFSDGNSGTGTESITGDFTILNSQPGEVNIDGDQKSTITLTIRRHGPTAATQNT